MIGLSRSHNRAVAPPESPTNRGRQMKKFSMVLSCAISLGAGNLGAADHRDGPRISVDAAVDIGDLYLFLDPTDNTRAVLSMTVGGFMIPSEAVNQAIFDPSARYQFQIEGTGDAIFDALINVTFSPRTSTSAAQNATVQMFQGTNKVFDFVAPATNPSLEATAPPQVVTTDSSSGVKFSPDRSMIHSFSTSRDSPDGSIRSWPAIGTTPS